MATNVKEELNVYSSKSSNKKIYLLLVLILFIVGVLVYYFLLKGSTTTEDVAYNTKKVIRNDLAVTVLTTGNLAPTNSVDIGIEVSGTIKEIYVDFNDEVKVGQILAKLDTTKLKATLDSSKASLSTAKANLKENEVNVKSTKLKYDRLQKTFTQSKGKYPSQNDLDDARFSYESAMATYESYKAKVDQAQYDLKTNADNLEKAVVKSSIDGLVLDRAVEVGQTVTASMSTPVLFTLAKDLTKMDLIVNIDEADVANIKKGLAVTFSVEAYPNEIFKGVIKQVRYNPIEESGVITYETVVEVNNERLLLRPGMTASAKIITKHVENALLIPNSALRFRPTFNKEQSKRPSGMDFTKGGRPPRPQTQAKEISNSPIKMVWLLENNQPKRVKVEVLESDGSLSAISSDEVNEGDEIIYSQKSVKQ